ncbi:MAG: Cytidine deaminase, partial [uncultured Gemmatimonadaceae bacterium]
DPAAHGRPPRGRAGGDGAGVRPLLELPGGRGAARGGRVGAPRLQRRERRVPGEHLRRARRAARRGRPRGARVRCARARDRGRRPDPAVRAVPAGAGRVRARPGDHEPHARRRRAPVAPLRAAAAPVQPVVAHAAL